MGSRLISRALSALLASALIATLTITSAPASTAASKSPTPKASATAKATVKASATPKATATKKPATKKPATKKPAPKKKKKAKATATPSPKPAWPPKGFSEEGGVFAKVPNAKELVGLISANKYLEQRIKGCTTYICAALQVASDTGCIWWQTIATVTDAKGVRLGEMTSAFSGSTVREFKTLIVITPESAEIGGAAKITSVLCHRQDRDPTTPGTFYTKVSG